MGKRVGPLILFSILFLKKRGEGGGQPLTSIFLILFKKIVTIAT
jgi:hypothetical protein